MSRSSIVCFRNDFRLEDNPALNGAVSQKTSIVPVFIYDPSLIDDWSLGGASKWWLHASILDLKTQIKGLGGQFILKSGNTLKVIQELVQETGAQSVYWNRRYQSDEVKVDKAVKQWLQDQAIHVESYKASILEEPWTTANKEGLPYKVYTPFWKSVKDRPINPPESLDLSSLRFSSQEIHSESLDSLGLLPESLDWPSKLADFWDVSESKAQILLDEFIKEASDEYHTERDRPDTTGTSFLSPYLRWGQISPRQIAHALCTRCDLEEIGPLTYLKEIYWREFAYYVLYHFPETPKKPLQKKYEKFPWESDTQSLDRWKKGETGYPIVDAGMRQLYATGWMHNRVRMIVASFLVKHMLHSWNAGAAWFWDTLVDADLASNTLGWQWSGGCGADAAPYFRIFNPMIQGMKFDPEGLYVKRWVPELSDMKPENIHQPWEASAEELKAASVVLGTSYPKAIIEHSFGRERALSALSSIK